MTDEPSKAGRKPDGKFGPGNRANPNGRPAGSRNRATIALEALIDGQGEAVINAMIEAAVGGDVSAGRALLDRLVPARRDRPVLFALPPLTSATDAPKAMAAIVQAVANGNLTASEASDLAALVEKFVKAIEASELAVRLSAIEKQLETRK
jgi:hypothetical protein